jgi:hypothetical protein
MQEDLFTKNLLHFDGADASTTIIDAFKCPWRAVGTAQLDTSQAKFGGSSLLLDGNSDHIAALHNPPGIDEFTYEVFVRLVSLTAHQIIICTGTADNNSFKIYADPNKKIILYDTDVRIQGASVLSVDTWYHIALVGNGGSAGSRTQKLYLNGTQEGSTYTADYNYLGSALYLGVHWNLAQQWWNGWMDEFRYSLGVQRWTGNFTPPTSPYGQKNHLISRRDRFRTTGISLG